MTPRNVTHQPAGAPFRDGDPGLLAVRRSLRERLLSLPFGAFARCAADLLARMGYQDVEPSPRKDWRGANGRRGEGGYDLLARLEGPGAPRRVLVQVKQFDEGQRVYQRAVDELRGTCLRAGASEALLLTTGPVSERIHRGTLAAAPLAPVRLIDGAELLDRLLQHGVGTTTQMQQGDVTGDPDACVPAEISAPAVDTAYFDRLVAMGKGKGNGRGDCAVSSEVLVTVQVRPVYRINGARTPEGVVRSTPINRER